ncbi:rRNA small subunit methyltransferase H [hydrothermal vent metagenome]|uniref:rRNA small subunit methyltransferase H n=1 Tax=hydrothermal vent metagenome TaxID=652676 RepID=A0A1W1BCJ7_9ZZZZ
MKKGTSLSETIPHIPVLYHEVLKSFEDIDKGVFVDCTMGYGGHSSMLLEQNKNIKLIGIDQDQTAIDFSTKRLAKFGNRVEIRRGRFSEVLKKIIDEGIDVRGILADIGVSSLQLDDKERGFSYESENLDMRMDKTQMLTAADVVNSYSESELARILFEYGEIKNAKRVANFIVSRRPFSSAKELSEAVGHLMPKGKKIHPSTLLFQAIRIEVNDELGELKRLLDVIESSDLKKTRVGIISFHSLEDRIVKQRFASWAKSCICPSDAMRCTCGNDHAIGRVLTKKPLTASKRELEANPRSRSAKLRVFEIER